MTVPLSLRQRLAIAFALAFALTLLVLFLTLHVALERLLLAGVDGDLAGSADALAAQVIDDGSRVPSAQVADAVAAVSLERLAGAPFSTAVLDPDGRVIAASAGMPPELLALSEADRAAILDGVTLDRTLKLPRGVALRRHVQAAPGGGEVAAIVIAAAPLGPVTAAIDRLQWLLIAEAVAGVLIATAAGYLVARRGLRPLDDVARHAAEIEAHDLAGRLRMATAPDEVRRLADTFDAMLDRLERAFALQRTFALDVAHELRTPLTALRGNLDVLLLDPSLTPEHRAEIERLSAETGRLMRLTANLLSLAQAEAGRLPERRPVQLDLLCLEVYRQARVLRPGVQLRLGHEDQVAVLGDRDLLKQLLLNLVENGLKYTPPGGSVSLSLFRKGERARLIVSDSGPGIAPEHLPHIFERFYRAPVDGGRLAGGTGIGLAVAKWIADAHGGRIEARSRPGQGTTFSVDLPLAGEPSAELSNSNPALTAP